MLPRPVDGPKVSMVSPSPPSWMAMRVLWSGWSRRAEPSSVSPPPVAFAVAVEAGVLPNVDGFGVVPVPVAPVVVHGPVPQMVATAEVLRGRVVRDHALLLRCAPMSSVVVVEDSDDLLPVSKRTRQALGSSPPP